MKWKEKSYKTEERTFLLFSFHFQNHWNLFWVYQNGNFLPEKVFLRRKKSGKMTLPLWKMSSYTSDYMGSTTPLPPSHYFIIC